MGTKVTHLTSEVAYNAVNLLDHGLGQDLDLDPDFHGRDGSTCDRKAGVDNHVAVRYEFTKSTITATSLK